MEVNIQSIFLPFHQVLLCESKSTCQCSIPGWVNHFLSWEGFEPLARLTYTTYLVHMTVIAVINIKQNFTVAVSDLYAVRHSLIVRLGWVGLG